MAVQTKLFNFFSNPGNFRPILSNRFTVNNNAPVAFIRADTKNKLKTLPDKPKKPTTPFLKYSVDHRGDVLKQHPNAKLPEVATILGEQWKKVNADVKKKYEEQYKNEMAVYTKQHLEYMANLTDDQKHLLNEAAKEKKHAKETRKLHQFNKESNKPKRARTPYMYYMMEKASGIKGGIKKFLSDHKGDWSNLPEAEKQKYVHMYEDDKKRYELEMEVWEAKMIKEGHTDAVRKSTLDHESKHPIRRKTSKKHGDQ